MTSPDNGTTRVDVDQQFMSKASEELRTNERRFMKKLALGIIERKDDEQKVLERLQILRDERKTGLLKLKKFFWEREQTLLHLACKFRASSKVLKAIIDACPDLLRETRSENYSGQTVLHIAVSSKKSKMAALILREFQERFSDPQWLLKQRATGPRFANTAMMGELPLSIAALTGSIKARDMVDLLLEKGAKIFGQNSHGDTVFHSIIKYCSIYPEKTKDLIAMCLHLHRKLEKRPHEELKKRLVPDREDALSVWQLSNEDSLTPLHLAAQLGQAQLFKVILTLKRVYCRTFSGEGLFDIHRYDITEIDNTAHAQYVKWHDGEIAKRHEPHDVESSAKKPNKMDNTVDVLCLSKNKKTDHVYRHQSVLDTIILCNFKRARDLIDNGILRAIIRKKWARYQYLYYVWGVLHLLYMSLLTWFAMDKTVVISHIANSTAPAPTPVQTNFVLGFSIVNFLTAVALIGVEGWRLLKWRKPWNLHRIHHNGLYRLLLIGFGLSLMWDSMHYWIVINNTVQEYAVIYANLGVTLSQLLGWWFLTFFLRAFHKFSFLTVMFQKVLLGDFIRFAVIIALVLVAFSITLHMALLQSNPHMQDGFSHTLFTTFLLMLGFGDVGVEDFYARWLTSVLYIAFLLLTTLLMLNALIAMMTNTCSLVAEDRKLQWELQRLSIILFLEQMLPARYRVVCGKEREVTIFSFRQNSARKVIRYYMEFTTLRSLDSRSDFAGIGAPGSVAPSQDWDSDSGQSENDCCSQGKQQLRRLDSSSPSTASSTWKHLQLEDYTVSHPPTDVEEEEEEETRCRIRLRPAPTLPPAPATPPAATLPAAAPATPPALQT